MNNSIKKTIALLVALGIVFGTMYGCGKKNNTDKDETTTTPSIVTADIQESNTLTTKIEATKNGKEFDEGKNGSEITENDTDKTINNAIKKEITNRVNTTSKAESVTQLSKKDKIYNAYVKVLENNKVESSWEIGEQVLPEYNLFDFDNDNVMELLFFSEFLRCGDIYVYRYDMNSDSAVFAGTIDYIRHHSQIGETSDGEVILATIWRGLNTENEMKKYTLKGDKIVSEQIAYNGPNDNSDAWFDMLDSSEYFDGNLSGNWQVDNSDGKYFDYLQKVTGLR